MENKNTFKIQNPSFGSDFEMFVEDTNTHQIVSVVGKLGGTKEEALDIGEGCYRQEDCTQAEFNIPVVYNADDFIKYIRYCKDQGNKLLGEIGCQLKAGTSHIFPKKELQTEQSTTFGCSSSTNPYLMEAYKPTAEDAGDMRTASIHMHVGFPRYDSNKTQAKYPDFCKFLKYMDVYLGIPSVLIDADEDRRKLYGKAGDGRRKRLNDIEIWEYRCLGGNLLASDNVLRWIFNQTKLAIEAFNNNLELPDEDLVQKCINNSDKELAFMFCEENLITAPCVEIMDGHLIAFLKREKKDYVK